jgi:hypothetical protein
MVQRTVKIIGKVFAQDRAVNMHCVYNGVEVLNGPVPATVVDYLPIDGPEAIDEELISFYTDTGDTGKIPVTITVTGGVLFFVCFKMNYIYKGILRTPTDPEIEIDINDPDTFRELIVNFPDLEFGRPNIVSTESDGILNLHKDGRPWCWRSDVGDQLGNWTYPVYAGETISFDYYIDPAKTVQ